MSPKAQNSFLMSKNIQEKNEGVDWALNPKLWISTHRIAGSCTAAWGTWQQVAFGLPNSGTRGKDAGAKREVACMNPVKRADNSLGNTFIHDYLSSFNQFHFNNNINKWGF